LQKKILVAHRSLSAFFKFFSYNKKIKSTGRAKKIDRWHVKRPDKTRVKVCGKLYVHTRQKNSSSTTGQRKKTKKKNVVKSHGLHDINVHRV